MDRHLEFLTQFSQSHPWERKWLLAPSLAVGTQWVEWLARQQVSCVNLAAATCDTLARELAQPVLIDEGLAVLPDDVAALILRTAWEQLPASGYFRRLPASAGVLAALVQTINDLRLQEATPSELVSLAARSHSSGRLSELADLLSFWEAWLQQHAFVDRAGVLAIARRAVIDRPPADLIFVPQDMELHGLAARLVGDYPSDRRHRVPSPLPTAAKGESTKHSHVRFFRAVGSACEVRGVLRRIAECQFPLDHVEVLATDFSQTATLLLDLMPQDADGDPLSRITLAQGLPISRSRPARALAGFVQWAESDFGVREFCLLLENGLIHTNDQWGPALARELRRLRLKAGAESYLPTIERELQRQQHDRLTADDLRRDGIDARVARLQALNGLCQQFLPLASELRHSQTSSFAAAQQLLDSCVVRDSVDAAAVSTTQAALSRQIEWQKTLNLTMSAASWLESFLADTHILQSTPRPGRLHVSSMFHGGQSGRPVCFVTGMEDRRLPGAIRPDPALSDEERRQLRSDMPTSSSRQATAMRHVQAAVTQRRSDVFFSWSCVSAVDGSESFAARIVHELAMEVTQTPPGDWSQLLLEDEAGWPQSYAIARPESATTNCEAHVQALLEEKNPRARLEAMHPHFMAGQQAVLQRTRQFSEYSGDVSQSMSQVNVFDDARHVYSASALETLGRCPLAFFFGRRLRGFQAEEFDSDLERWLDPALFGQLVHALFQRFLVTHADGCPDFDQHWPGLKALVVELAGEYEGRYPPASRSSYRQDLARLLRIARTFLKEETSWYQRTGATAVYLEATLGMPRRDSQMATELDCAEPVPVVLESGRTVFGRAQVDRIDRLSGHRYSICDYKTGSAWGYDRQSPFQGGRHLQSTFYLKLVQKVLRDHLGDENAVTHFDYFFPGVRGDGLRIGWDSSELETGVRIVETLADLDQAGAYPPTNCADDCRFCDYRPVCGNVAELAKAATAWYRQDERLAGLQEVRHGVAE